MLLFDEEKDGIQLKKAKIKTGAITSIIPELINLNNELEKKEQKAYTITLDYVCLDGFYKFSVEVKRTYGFDNDPLFNIRFSLKDLNAGLALFNDIRDCYIENNEMAYTAFTMKHDGTTAESYNATGMNQIHLCYKIHSQEEYEKLQQYNDSLYKEQNPKIKLKKITNKHA